jgi:CheY-like chemotaxis protein
MALFEIVLRRAGEPDEVRYADRGYGLGDELQLERETWVVTSLELPERAEAASRIVVRPAAELRAQVRVLIADDNAGIRGLFVDLIVTHPGLTLVAVASDAESAIEAAATERPDVAVLDVRMPGGGLHALERIGQVSPQTKVIAFTGDEGSAHEMLEAGAVAAIAKGDPIANLIAEIARAGIAGVTAVDAEEEGPEGAVPVLPTTGPAPSRPMHDLPPPDESLGG